MNENDVLQLVQRWQDPGTWHAVQSAGTNAAELQGQADKLGDDARFILDRGDAETARTLKGESNHLRKCAAAVLSQRFERASEFMQIETWIRKHRPELLEFVPIPKFEGDPSEAIRDLKRLESRIRKPAAASPDKPGPEFTRRADVRGKYFQVWAFVQKPGNASKSNAAISEATSVHKDMIARILAETRPPKPEELETTRTVKKKR